MIEVIVNIALIRTKKYRWYCIEAIKKLI